MISIKALEVTPIPLDLPGLVFRGKMPQKGQLEHLEDYNTLHKITHIFTLQTESEWKYGLGLNLKALYEEKGYTVEHYPISDGQIIEKSKMKELISKIIAVTSEGKNVLVHCKGGTGRTSMVLSCLAMDALGLEPVKAMSLVNQAIPGCEHQRNTIQNTFINGFNLDAIPLLATEGDLLKKSLPLEVTPIPFDLGGKVFRGKMPRKGQLECLDEYQSLHQITHIFMLQTEDELKRHLGKDLKEIYEEKGYTVTHCPIKDAGIIDKTTMKELVTNIMAVTSEGKNVLVHCKGGTGRTSMVLSCLGIEALDYDPAEAMSVVSQAIPGCEKIRTGIQNAFIKIYNTDEILPVQAIGDAAKIAPKFEVTHIPFDLGGKVFRGKMPNKLQLKHLDRYQTDQKITHIIMLQTEDEWTKRLELDLRKVYTEQGFKIEHYPIIDGYTIEKPKMKELVSKIIAVTSEGGNVLIHCMGGRGRTAMVLACLAIEALKMDGLKAMDYIKFFIPGSEFRTNTFQRPFILNYKDK